MNVANISSEEEIKTKLTIPDSKCLCKVIKTDVKKGSLYLPYQKNTKECIVLVKGKECKLNVNPGDRCIYSHYSNLGLEINNEIYVLLTEDEILAKLTELAPLPNA